MFRENFNFYCYSFYFQVNVDDFVLFDYIFGLDELSVRELEDLAANLDETRCRAKVVSLGSYLKNCDDESINDPFFVSSFFIF